MDKSVDQVEWALVLISPSLLVGVDEALTQYQSGIVGMLPEGALRERQLGTILKAHPVSASLSPPALAPEAKKRAGNAQT